MTFESVYITVVLVAGITVAAAGMWLALKIHEHLRNDVDVQNDVLRELNQRLQTMEQERLAAIPEQERYRASQARIIDDLRAQNERLSLASQRPTTLPTAAYQPPPGMRLPSATKNAFSSEALFAQQADMRTHDLGLQALLGALTNAVSQLYGLPDLTLGNLRFSINFATPPGSAIRRYSIRLLVPIVARLEMAQYYDGGRQRLYWEVRDILTGQAVELALPAAEVLGFNVTPGEDDAADGRELRSISLD